MPNGIIMNGNSGGYTGYRGGAPLLHQMQSSAIHQQARILRNFVPVPLPFYDWHKTVLEPMELPAIMSGVKTPCKQSFTFSLPREYFVNWSINSPLPRYEIQLRFFQVPENYASQELPDDFPLNCVARIEEQHVQLPVYRVTSEILRDRATGAAKSAASGDVTNNDRPSHRQEEHVTRDLIRARLGGGNDDDIAMAQLKISLLCPVRIT
ncbi:hypothetical protein ANCCEY_03017 [Ancylostoma ceylanicum]|uniref:PINIT domain-containing protein n=1 Tax=Ancylostoma ceylanicum TaxID=53326 RepID=A0A0D6M367_9BILA|nr:hypothetical protein ANCCEY_03017 [Ancylostoma ceylanicum]